MVHCWLTWRLGSGFYFGGRIPESLVNDWRSKGKKQVIAQAEIFSNPCVKRDLGGFDLSEECPLVYRQ